MYNQVANALGFQFVRQSVASHWRGEEDISVDQMQAFNRDRSKKMKVPFQSWLVGTTSNDLDSDDESDESDGSGFAELEDGSGTTNKSGLPAFGIETRKGSKYRGVFRVSDQEWDVYLTPSNALGADHRAKVCVGC